MFLVVLLCLLVHVVVVVCWCFLILPVLILEGSEIALGFLGLGYKRVRLGRKTPVHEFFRGSSGDQSRPRVWKRLKLRVSFVGEDDDVGRRQLLDHLDFWVSCS